MDECMMLNDLLECSVCLEQLDSKSKVLPCQHTFCKRCLDEIVSSRKELRCPECRVLVDTKVDELPGNILLIRILEGMKNVPRNRGLVAPPDAETEPIARDDSNGLQPQPQQRIASVVNNGSSVGQFGSPLPPKQPAGASVYQPCARALYSYEAKEAGDLSFKKDDIIILRKKIDQNWFHGELSGKHGFFPASYVRVITPLPVHMPQCKAIYDFRMSGNEEKDCLAFTKGELIVVIRRVDENWAEGKLGDRIGIFPISFVEMNGAARSLMKLSTNFQSGPSRVAPPTPSSDSDTTPLITPAPHATVTAGGGVHPLPLIQPLSSSSSSPSSSSSTTTCTSSSSSSSASTPSSPAVAAATPSLIPLAVPPHQIRQPPQPQQKQQQQHQQQPQAVPPPLPAPRQTQTQTHNHHQQPQQQQQQHRDKRHSMTVAGSAGFGRTPPTQPAVSARRRSANIVDLGESDMTTSSGLPPAPPPLAETSHSSGGGSSSNTACSSTPNLFAPIGEVGSLQTTTTTNNQVLVFYVALYPYKPQKEDELELKKGELYSVSEKCQDGWYKGVSLRTTRSGVFPGNYVQAAKSSLLQAHFRQTSSSLANVRPTSSRLSSLPNSATSAACSSVPPSGAAATSANSQHCSSRTHHHHQHNHHHHYQNASSRDVAASPTAAAAAASSQSAGNGDAGSLSRARAAAAAAVSERTHGFLEWARSVTASYSPNSSKQLNHSPRYRSHTAPRQSTTTVSLAPSRSVVVPELPPRVSTQGGSTAGTAATNVATAASSSLSSPAQTSSISQSWHGTPSTQPQRVFPSATPLSRSMQTSSDAAADRIGDGTPASSSTAHATSVSNHVHRHEKLAAKREKKERKHRDKVSFMKRLTAKKKLKSPTPCGYSMDNPVFVDCPQTSGGSSTVEGTHVAHTAHARSGSCPSDVVFAVTPAAGASRSSGHKKSNSIDGSTESYANGGGRANFPRPPVPLVRERYRCIVPYPPNGENELELKVGDIIYVQKKRDDGWYKGVLHRTGKSGLFPASFVESY